MRQGFVALLDGLIEGIDSLIDNPFHQLGGGRSIKIGHAPQLVEHLSLLLLTLLPILLLHLLLVLLHLLLLLLLLGFPLLLLTLKLTTFIC
jgi:hypothetical protein